MGKQTPNANTWHRRPFVVATGLCVLAYCYLFFWLLDLPPIGQPTFRIDFMAVTVTRGDEVQDFVTAALHSRPVSALYVALQGLIGLIALDGQTRYIAYAAQHLGLLVYFLMMVRVVETLLQVRLGVLAMTAAWLLVIINPLTVEGVYKLETIVGTLSMVFGALSMLLLLRWDRARDTRSAIGFLLAYGLSVFAKEDFALPPLFLLTWIVLRPGIQGGSFAAGVRNHRWLVLATASLLLVFVAFNKLLVADRAFIEPTADPASPYFMSLAPSSLLKVASHYTFNLGSSVSVLFYAHSTLTLAALTFSDRRAEAALIACMVGGLMAPYLIMPNHIFGYYSIKWFAIQAITAVALLRLLLPSAALASAVAVAGALWLVTPTLKAIDARTHLMWHQANFLRHHFSVSGRLYQTLVRHREALNRFERVGVLGIGVGGIVHTPWQSNGETAFFLSGDLDLSPDWVLFLQQDGASYSAPGRSASSEPLVITRKLSDLKSNGDLPLMLIQKDGSGTLFERASQLREEDLARAVGIHPPDVWVAVGGTHVSASPAHVASCDGGKRPSVDLSWDLTKAAPAGVRIWVYDGSSRKLWTIAQARGRARTGPWGQGGLRFDIEDNATGRALAKLTIGGARCS